MIAVVPHGSPVVRYEEVRDRIELNPAPLLGYVYNLAPLSREMASVSVRASTVFHRERLRSPDNLDEAVAQPSNGRTSEQPPKRSWRSGCADRPDETPERAEPAAPLVVAVAPLPEPARPAAGNGSHVAVPQAPVLSELVLSTGTSSELDDYLYATVLETLLGDRSGQMVGPAPEVKTQPFTPSAQDQGLAHAGHHRVAASPDGAGRAPAPGRWRRSWWWSSTTRQPTRQQPSTTGRESASSPAMSSSPTATRRYGISRAARALSRRWSTPQLHPSQHRTASSWDAERPDRGVQPQAQVGGGGGQGEAEIAEIDARLKELRTFHIALGWLDEGTTPDARIFYPWRDAGAQPAGWHPQFSEGIRPNIAPIQRLGLLSAPVLSERSQTFAPA